MKGTLVLLLVCCCLFMSHVKAARDQSTDRVSSKIYKEIKSVLACFRRMNGTHQIGCSSSMNGDVGVVHFVNTTSNTTEEFDVNWIASQGPHAPYIAVLNPSSFRYNILDKFSLSGRVNGVLLIRKNETEVKKFSPDKSCPNQGYGFYKDPNKEHYCPKRNDAPLTNDLLFRDWGFPIFYVSDTAKVGEHGIDSIVDCFVKYNEPHKDGTPREWPLCAAQLQSFMSAAVDTPTCLRRSQMSQFSITQRKDCDPLGDRNLMTTLVPSNHTTTEESYGDVIVIAARLDAASMFDKIAPGADSAATGITAVLAILQNLAKIKEKLSEAESIKNVYFILFNGEAFDYIGSSKVVYDMAQDKFPFDVQGQDNSTFFPALLRMKNIKYYIELNQVALNSSNSFESYYIHQNWDASSTTTSTLSGLNDALTANGNLFSVNIASRSRPSDWLGVPPSSLQTFLGNNSDFPGIVITNYDTNSTFRNKLYNSMFDDASQIGYNETVVSIAGLAASIACTVEQLILGQSRTCSVAPNPQAVDDILQCYVKSGTCELFQKVSSSEVAPRLRETPNFYVGVASQNYDLLSLTSITKNVMAYFQGDVVIEKDEAACHPDPKTPNLDYVFMNGSCYETTVIATQAISPAFEIKNYDWTSRQYSSWTESVWVKMSVRIFLKPSLAHDLVTLFSGLAVFGISFILVGWISTKTDIIFPSRPEQIC